MTPIEVRSAAPGRTISPEAADARWGDSEAPPASESLLMTAFRIFQIIVILSFWGGLLTFFLLFIAPRYVGRAG